MRKRVEDSEMARTPRDSRLETRAARSRLAISKYHWRGVAQGLALGYRRGARGGSWTVKRLMGDNRYETKRIGKADDFVDADGVVFLDYFQAQEKARGFASEQVKREQFGPYRVKDAIGDYLAWFQEHRKSFHGTKRVCERHILPPLGDRLVSERVTDDVRSWRRRLARAKPRVRTREGTPQRYGAIRDPRARKASANRTLTILKAALNYAYNEGKVPSDDAWRRVKPYRNVDAPRVRYLTEDECRRLLNACAPDFRQIVRGALLSGARYGELCVLRVGDFDT